MKKAISFYLNGRLQELRVKPETTILEMVRGLLGLTGTKEGCGEGDCGACTIVVGECQNGEVHYKAAVGCLYLAAQLEGKHLITIEGMSPSRTELHPIQQAIIDAHATQCGFCTPGIALSLQALYLENSSPSPEDIRRTLEGNLCRCTGYVAIRKVPDFISQLHLEPSGYRPAYLSAVEAHQRAWVQEDLLLEADEQVFYSPVSTENLKAFLRDRKDQNSDLRFINGGTDVVVGIKKRHQHPRVLIDLSRIDSLQRLESSDSELVVGGGVSLSRLAQACSEKLPVLASVISRMCSEQVRTLATLAGNIANASPVADTVPLLMALGAQLILHSVQGERSVPVDAFYLGYKKTQMQADEWIDSIRIPLDASRLVTFEKATKRRELDISAANSAIALTVTNGVIRDARLACGGVGPTTLLMRKTSDALVGKAFSEETFLAAGKVMSCDATPIFDVRGSAEYRSRVLQNLLVKHFVTFEHILEASK